MKRNELYRLIQQTEREFERRKGKRAIYTILAYTAVMLLIFYWQGELEPFNLWNLAGAAIGCMFLSGIAFLANAIIFDQLFRINEEEKNHLEYLKKKLEDMEGL